MYLTSPISFAWIAAMSMVFPLGPEISNIRFLSFFGTFSSKPLKSSLAFCCCLPSFFSTRRSQNYKKDKCGLIRWSKFLPLWFLAMYQGMSLQKRCCYWGCCAYLVHYDSGDAIHAASPADSLVFSEHGVHGVVRHFRHHPAPLCAENLHSFWTVEPG